MSTEPWLRGVEPGIDPVLGHLLRSAQHIREDLNKALASLTADQIWAKPHGLTSAGFHAKHIAQSTQRLCEYLEGKQLSAEQLAAISQESSGTEPAAELLARVDAALNRYEQLVRTLPPWEFSLPREVGRQRLRTTAVGLAIHIAEHGLRHVGQAIAAAKLAVAAPSAKL